MDRSQTGSGLKFGGAWTGPLIIDITPCSTAPSSPMCEDRRAGSFFDSESCKSTDRCTEEIRPNCSIMQEMANSLRMTVSTKALTEHSYNSEVALLTHLHSNAVTLPDVEALVPSLRHNFKVMGKLATNIGLYHSRGCINSQDLELILIHIFTHDDHQSYLFQRTTAQIERFQRERAERYWSRLTAKQQQQQQQREDILRQRHAEKEHRDAKHRRQTIPSMYRKVSLHGFLPGECSSIADVITEIDGMDWTQAQKIQEAAGENTLTRRNKVKKADVVPVQAEKADVVTVDSFWAKTRLHNGPGLEDRRRPKVKLPRKNGDGRVVLMAVEDVGLVKTKCWRNELLVQSKAVTSHLFSKEGGEVVLRLSPH